MKPKQLTLRGLDPAVATRLRAEAARRGASINRTALALLKASVGLDEPPRKTAGEYHDLDSLAGTWTEEDAREFEARLVEIRRTDPEMWP